MADYINSADTLGFYKFNSSDVLNNSIINSGVDLRTAFLNESGEFWTLTSGQVSRVSRTTEKYKSRPSGLMIPEESCIRFDTKMVLSKKNNR